MVHDAPQVLMLQLTHWAIPFLLGEKYSVMFSLRYIYIYIYIYFFGYPVPYFPKQT